MDAHIQVSDDFNSNAMSLTYDDNGNLTDDGVLRYVYDGWNRLVKVQRVAAGDTTTVAEYRYLPDNRRASKVVSHSGVEAVANDGGDTTVHFYYGGVPWAAGGVSRWNICETRNGSEQVTRQWVWGTQYVDEPVFMDVNLDSVTDADCDPDTTGTGEIEQTHDRRYFYVQDRNWNVVALLESDDGVGTQGRIAERYSYTAYGEFVVLNGQTASGNLGNVLPTSAIGNVFAHQGLSFDQEKGSYQNRHREYTCRHQRFGQRDPLRLCTWRSKACTHNRPSADGEHLYAYERSLPVNAGDPSGLCSTVWLNNTSHYYEDRAACQSDSHPCPEGYSRFCYGRDETFPEFQEEFHTYHSVCAMCVGNCSDPETSCGKCVRLTITPHKESCMIETLYQEECCCRTYD